MATEGDARLQAALAASARAEASLSSLFRAIEHLGNGVGGAREANESLTLELEALRDMLGSTSDQQQLFQQKIAQVELALDRTRKEFERERAFLIDQQDSFLIALLDEQEDELKLRDSQIETLRSRLAEVEQRTLVTVPPPLVPLSGSQTLEARLSEPHAAEAPGSELDRAERAELERTAQKLSEDRERARETVARLQAQRDEAQIAVVRISKERDDALLMIHRLKAELGGPRIPLSTRPPSSSDLRRDSSAGRAFGSTAALTLDQLEMEARLNRPTAPSPPSSATSSLNPSISTAPTAPPKSQPISSVLSPPSSSPIASLIPSRLSPPPARLSPTPGKISQQPVRLSPPPEELRRALTAPPWVQSMASSRPPLKQKPDPSTRPLVGYSMSNESGEAEHLEGVRLSSKPPGSDKR